MSTKRKVALVTGGAVRIGRSIVEALAGEGLGVVIHCDRSLAEATALAAEILKAVEAKDDGTRVLFESILRDEEDHLNDLEAKEAQIGITGLQIFVGEQL